MTKRLGALCAVFVAASACNSNDSLLSNRDGGPQDGGTGGARGTGGVPGSGGAGAHGTGGTVGGGTGGAGGGAAACAAISALDRSCTADTDCTAAAHTANCCGQIRYIGINVAGYQTFTAMEGTCSASYPACGCAAGPPMMDDGSIDGRMNRTALIPAGVACLRGTCTTYVRDCDKPCEGGTTCFVCTSHMTTFAACTTACNDTAASADCQDATLPLCQFGQSGNRAGTFCTATGIACDTK